ncbi:hypothetical protein V6Z12_D05G239300 [Gossypium hirsutum]
MPLGLILGIGRTGRKVPHRSIFYPRNEPLEITYYESKNCKSTGFHTCKAQTLCISVPERYQNCGGC